jgi:hypothetical protein
MKRIIWFFIIFFIGAINGTSIGSEIPKELLPILEKKGDIALNWVPQFGMFAIQPLFGNFQR